MYVLDVHRIADKLSLWKIPNLRPSEWEHVSSYVWILCWWKLTDLCTMSAQNIWKNISRCWNRKCLILAPPMVWRSAGKTNQRTNLVVCFSLLASTLRARWILPAHCFVWVYKDKAAWEGLLLHVSVDECKFKKERPFFARICAKCTLLCCGFARGKETQIQTSYNRSIQEKAICSNQEVGMKSEYTAGIEWSNERSSPNHFFLEILF